MKFSIISLLLPCLTCIVLLFGGIKTGRGQDISIARRGMLNDAQRKEIINSANLVYTQPASRSEAGQPIGNGRMGSLVWTTPTAVHLQVNRVDVFGNGSNSNNFYQRNTDYCGGVGFVDIDFGVPVFKDEGFQQRLCVYDGMCSIKSRSVTAKLLTWTVDDVMAVQIGRLEASKQNPAVILRMLRMPHTIRGNHSAISTLKMIDGLMVLSQVFKEDDFYCSSAVVIGEAFEDPNRTSHKSSVNIDTMNDMAIRLRLEQSQSVKSGARTVYIASAASFDSTKDIVKEAIGKFKNARSKGWERISKDNHSWWADFWRQSFVKLTSKDGVAEELMRNYYYYLYIMGASSRGDFPVKFNGMLWNTGGDARQWGGAFWGANQSCFYEALQAAGHPELMRPMFDMYSNAYSSFCLAAHQQWGANGIYIPETMGFDGVPALPDSIASEMRDLYLLRKPWAERSFRFKEYAYTKLPFLSRWNWKSTGRYEHGNWVYVERGDGPFGPVNHIFSRGAKIAYSYWQQYEFGLDVDWLAKRAYPMIKGVAEFYRSFPNLVKDVDGYFNITHVNDNESIWDAKNPVEEMSAMRGILSVAIRASELLGVDEALRKKWIYLLRHLAPLATSKSMVGLESSPEVWVGALSSDSPIRANRSRLPDGNTMPVWFFDFCNKGGSEQSLKIANNTLDAYFSGRPVKEFTPHILSKIPLAAAILGRSNYIKYLLPNMLKGNPRIHVLENRMDLSEGFFTTNIQRIGNVTMALEQSLCSSLPTGPGANSIIDVFSAWPRSWEASFSLWCRGGFVAQSEINNGQIQYLKLDSRLGGDLRVRNPWHGQDKGVRVYKNGIGLYDAAKEMITTSTVKGDEILLVPIGRESSKSH